RATRRATDWQAGQGVLTDLLETEERDDAEGHGRVETQTALVRAQHRVELHAEAAVDLHLAVVVDPGHAEDDLALWLAHALDEPILRVVLVLLQNTLQRLQNFCDGLMELRFACISLQDLFVVLIDGLINVHRFLLYGC